MLKKGKGRGTPKNPCRPIYWMPVCGILLCLITAKLILWKKIPETAIPILPQIIGAIVSFLGAFRGARLAPRRCFLWGMINSCTLFLMLMLGNLLFFGIAFHGIGSMCIWILGGGVTGSILSNIKRGKIA